MLKLFIYATTKLFKFLTVLSPINENKLKTDVTFYSCVFHLET